MCAFVHAKRIPYHTYLLFAFWRENVNSNGIVGICTYHQARLEKSKPHGGILGNPYKSP